MVHSTEDMTCCYLFIYGCCYRVTPNERDGRCMLLLLLLLLLLLIKVVSPPAYFLPCFVLP